MDKSENYNDEILTDEIQALFSGYDILVIIFRVMLRELDIVEIIPEHKY